METEGQLNATERAHITKTILDASVKPEVVVEVGTWLGGGSTLHILRALQANGTGHLWGVEAFKDIYQKMIENIRRGAPEAAGRFTPILGFSTQVLPEWLNRLPHGKDIDMVFLDGGDNPDEQVEEFKLLEKRIKIGGILMAHDARTRKGKWLVPYLMLLDNWETHIFDYSNYGLLHAIKLKAIPSTASLISAEQKLKRLRLAPVELVGRYTPSWLCGLILRSMPKRLARKLTIGKE